jgi:hypothetical protein
MALGVTLTDFCDQMVALLQNNAESLGIADDSVYYGDQTRIPHSPAVCVEPDTKAADLYGAGRMTELKVTLYLLVYHSEVRDLSSNRRDADLLAEDIAVLVNKDPTFYGLAIHCYVTEVKSGYSIKDRTTMRSTRIAWEATSQERLPNQGEV